MSKFRIIKEERYFEGEKWTHYIIQKCETFLFLHHWVDEVETFSYLPDVRKYIRDLKKEEEFGARKKVIEYL